MQAGIDRYLKEYNYHVSIIRDRAFSASRAVVEGKCKNFRKHGKRKQPNKSNSLSCCGKHIVRMWVISGSLSNVFNKFNMVDVTL